MVSVYEEWARPLSIDRAELHAQGLSDELAIPPKLREGDTIEHLRVGKPVHWVELTGELWSRPFRHVLRPDPDESRRWAALVFGQPEHVSLSEPEMMALAMHGGAVSPVTSYLAIEPGVRPSTEGLDTIELSGIGSGGVGIGESIALGSVGFTGCGGASRFDPEAALQRLLDPAWSHCGGAPGTARVVVETTGTEIVDVPEVTLDDQDAVLRSCLLEATWALALQGEFERYSFRRFELRV
jgi:hypothetical protein